MLDINIPTSPLPTLIKPKAFAEKGLETVKVILHNTLIVIAMQTVVLLQFYIFFSKSLSTLTEFGEAAMNKSSQNML